MDDRFLARKPSELATCLKLLYANGVQFSIELQERSKKIVYLVHVYAEEEQVAQLAEIYRIMIS